MSARGRLSAKVVVVTGAARGQGATEAKALTREGARVIATDAAESPGGPGSPPSWAVRFSGMPVEKRLTHAGVGGHEHRAGMPTVGQEGLTRL